VIGRRRDVRSSNEEIVIMVMNERKSRSGNGRRAAGCLSCPYRADNEDKRKQCIGYRTSCVKLYSYEILV